MEYQGRLFQVLKCFEFYKAEKFTNILSKSLYATQFYFNQGSNK